MTEHKNSTARYCLTASAFVLGAILLLSIFMRGGFERPADASLVVSADTITLMTAQTRQDEEAVFVLDSVNEALLIYTLSLRGNQGRLELSDRVNLAQLFRGGGRGRQ